MQFFISSRFYVLHSKYNHTSGTSFLDYIFVFLAYFTSLKGIKQTLRSSCCPSVSICVIPSTGNTISIPEIPHWFSRHLVWMFFDSGGQYNTTLCTFLQSVITWRTQNLEKRKQVHQLLYSPYMMQGNRYVEHEQPAGRYTFCLAFSN